MKFHRHVVNVTVRADFASRWSLQRFGEQAHSCHSRFDVARVFRRHSTGEAFGADSALSEVSLPFDGSGNAQV